MSNNTVMITNTPIPNILVINLIQKDYEIT